MPRAGCWVAVLDSRGLSRAENDCTQYLSRAERERHSSTRGSKRREEWLAGRLAAKYVFLHGLEMGSDAEVREWQPTLMRVSSRSLDAFPAWMYQALEVTATAGGPRLVWLGRDHAASISLSHTPGDACACLAAHGIAGVDVEGVAARVDAFYGSNYTAAERAWVGRGVATEPGSREWMYTLLWTIKESALKARVCVQKSPWSFAGVEVTGLPEPEDVMWAYRRSTLGGRFGRFSAAIDAERRRTSVEIAYAGSRDLIVAVVKPFEHGMH